MPERPDLEYIVPILARELSGKAIKVRDFLKVRGRPGEPCVRCGDTLRRAGIHGHDAIFCPTCQPDARGSAIVDFRRVGAAAGGRHGGG